MTTTILTAGRTTGVVVDGKVHVLKRSSSRFGLRFNGDRLQFCCQDGCCDRGLQPDVAKVVEEAKALGATKVIIRTGQREFYCSRIAGLPVEDVSNHVGRVHGDIAVDRAW